jgi:hypothetical protein
VARFGATLGFRGRCRLLRGWRCRRDRDRSGGGECGRHAVRQDSRAPGVGEHHAAQPLGDAARSPLEGDGVLGQAGQLGVGGSQHRAAKAQPPVSGDLRGDREPKVTALGEWLLREKPAAAHGEVGEDRRAAAQSDAVLDGRTDADAAAPALLRTAVQGVEEQQAQRGRVHRPTHDQVDTRALEHGAQRPRVLVEDRDPRGRRVLGADTELEEPLRRGDHQVPGERLVLGGRAAPALGELEAEPGHQGAGICELPVVDQEAQGLRGLFHSATPRSGDLRRSPSRSAASPRV